jgi:AraC-like DNA-binding protein
MAESVSAGFARGLMEFAVAGGADRRTLLVQAGIAAEDLEDIDRRIPFARYAALMHAGKALTGDPALALHYGAVDISQVSIVGLIGQASETALEAFAQLNRYVRLVVDVETEHPDRFRLIGEGGELSIVDTRRNPDAFPELGESAFSQLVSPMRRHGLGGAVKAVDFTHPEPSYRGAYDRTFGAPVRFGQARNALQIAPSLLTARVGLLPRYVFGVLAAKADALLQALDDAQSTRGQVERLLMPILHTGEVGMDVVAKKLGVSRPTLFRRLKAEGVTFAEVLDQLRRRMALSYIRGGKVSVNETAYLVGFSEPPAFSRAFKRWTGASPRAMKDTASKTPPDEPLSRRLARRRR